MSVGAALTGPGTVLAHGVGGRDDLPVPLGLALAGAAAALVISFLALGLLWREPRLRGGEGGDPAPAGLQRVLDASAFRAFAGALGVLALGYVGMASLFGRDDALNPTAGAVYVLLWVGVPFLSVLLGPVWRLVNPVRALHHALSRLIGVPPEQGLSRLPDGLGYWPAALSLLAFVWLELAAPENTSLPVLRTFVAAYVAVHLLAATWFGSGWFARGDGFEVFSSLVGRLSFLGRRDDGRLVWRNPLDGVASTPRRPGLFAVVGVLLGSTAFDSMSNAPWWVNFLQSSPLPVWLTSTLGLLAAVLVVTVAFAGAAAWSGRQSEISPSEASGHFAHTLVPIVVGYLVAHYWSLLVLVGQQTVIQLSDPLGTGANWLGTGDRGIDASLAAPDFTARLQVLAVVGGHLLGVVLAHDRAVRLLPRRHALAGQVPMLTLMVAYTVGGLFLLFAA